jgi:hypothetical protein
MVACRRRKQQAEWQLNVFKPVSLRSFILTNRLSRHDRGRFLQILCSSECCDKLCKVLSPLTVLGLSAGEKFGRRLQFRHRGGCRPHENDAGGILAESINIGGLAELMLQVPRINAVAPVFLDTKPDGAKGGGVCC